MGVLINTGLRKAWEPLIHSWNAVLDAETTHRSVVNLTNSPTIGCDSRLAPSRFITQSHRSRMNQRLPSEKIYQPILLVRGE